MLKLTKSLMHPKPGSKQQKGLVGPVVILRATTDTFPAGYHTRSQSVERELQRRSHATNHAVFSLSRWRHLSEIGPPVPLRFEERVGVGVGLGRVG